MNMTGEDSTPMEPPPPYTPRQTVNNNYNPNYNPNNNAFNGYAQAPLPQPPLPQLPLPQPPLPQVPYPQGKPLPPRQVPVQYQQAPPVRRHFPPRFNIYRAGWGLVFTLGEHQHQPLYTVTSHSGWSGNPDVVLHNGPSESAPPMATANKAMWSPDMTVSLPPARIGEWQAPSVEECVRGDGYGSLRFGFEIDVGNGGQSGAMRPLREVFEWRHTRGPEVCALGGIASGYKLVRMSGIRGGGPLAGDGNEVVAVFSFSGMSLTKSMCFGFMGSGLSNMLGERWEVMAVISALGIWDQERKRRARNSATA